MKALSIRQPWLNEIARGEKRVENRTWARHQPQQARRPPPLREVAVPDFKPERAYKVTSGEPGRKNQDIIEIRSLPDGGTERRVVLLVPDGTAPELKFDITSALRHAYEAGAEDQRAQSEPQGGVVGYVVATTTPDGFELESPGLWHGRRDADQERDDLIASLPRDYPHEYAVCAVLRLEEPRGRKESDDA